MSILEINNIEILKKITISNDDKNISFEKIKNIFDNYGVIFFKNMFNLNDINKILDDFKILDSDISMKNKFIVKKGYNAPATTDNFDPSFLKNENLDHLLKNIKQYPEFIKFLQSYFEFSDFFTGKTCVTSTHKTCPSSNPEQYQNWHTDNASMYWNSKYKSLTFWTPLTDSGKKIAPGLRVCCKKFDKDLFEYASESYWDKFNQEYKELIIFPNTSPGDCLIFDCHTVHGTAYTNKQNKIRYSLDFRLLSKQNHPLIGQDELIFSHQNNFNFMKYSQYTNKKISFFAKGINYIKKKIKYFFL